MTEGVGAAIARVNVPGDQFRTAYYESRPWAELHDDWKITMYPVDTTRTPVDEKGENLPTSPTATPVAEA